MSGFFWKIREQISNWLPLILVAGIAYGGWHFYKKGAFRHGIGPGITHVVGKVPYFGSRFTRLMRKEGFAVVKPAKRAHSRRHVIKGRRHRRHR